MNRLQPPPGPDQLSREPVEQLRVSRLVPDPAEVVAGSHQADTEVVLPEAIHNNARRERASAVIYIGQPMGESGAAIAAFLFTGFDPAGDISVIRTQGREDAQAYISGFLFGVSTLQQRVFTFVAAVPGKPLDV